MPLLFLHGFGRPKSPFAVSAQEIDSARRQILGEMETLLRGLAAQGAPADGGLSAAASAFSAEIEGRTVEMKASIETEFPTTASTLYAFECEMAAKMANLRAAAARML